MSCLHCTIEDDVKSSLKENGLEHTVANLFQVAAEVIADADQTEEEQLIMVARAYDHFIMCLLDAKDKCSHPAREKKQGTAH